MSGHSHWSKVRWKKGMLDTKRGKVFSKLSRQISIAAREKGGDPDANPALRMVVEKARQFNMSKENIERAIKKGTGELEGTKLESVIFEAYGPGGIAVIIEGITDNKNRALGEIKRTLSQNGGKLAGEGSVRWLFDKKGVVTTKKAEESKEDLELKAIEAGAEDTYWHDDTLDIYTKPEELEKIRKNLEGKGVKTESSSLDWVAKENLEVDSKDKEACQKLFEALDENDDVQEIYSNLKE